MRQLAKQGLLVAVAASGAVVSVAAGSAWADSGAHGTAGDSPGVGSGNAVSAPVDAPVNVCGNTVDVVGVLNPAFGNTCANAKTMPQQGASATAAPPADGMPTPRTREKVDAVSSPAAASPQVRPELAKTGGSSETTEILVPAGAALLLGGMLLYKRGRARRA